MKTITKGIITLSVILSCTNSQALQISVTGGNTETTSSQAQIANIKNQFELVVDAVENNENKLTTIEQSLNQINANLSAINSRLTSIESKVAKNTADIATLKNSSSSTVGTVTPPPAPQAYWRSTGNKYQTTPGQSKINNTATVGTKCNNVGATGYYNVTQKYCGAGGCIYYVADIAQCNY